jgi:hypothetical protein
MRTTLAVLALLSVTALASAADDVISWEDADKHVGEETTVEGRVVDVHCSQLSCLLAFEPSFNRFTAVVQARSFDVFPPDTLAQRYQGKLVQVHGKVETRDSKPEIVVEKPDDITLPGAKPRAQKAAESAARDAAETAQRMADVLERVEELTERMAAVQERMEALLTQLEERDAALAAAAQANQPPPPPAPSYGEPQPRPAYEALRTVKRGMSRAEVQRLVGAPEYVENGGGGWSTWYYGYGRSVSFDARGRVQAFVGFPAP